MNLRDFWGLSASDPKQTNRYYDIYGSSSSNPYLKAEKTSTSNNEVLKNAEHGGDNNLMIRLPNTDGDAIHEGNINSNIERAYTEGCTAVTADPNDENFSNVSDNYNAFKKALQPYGNTEININATVRYN